MTTIRLMFAPRVIVSGVHCMNTLHKRRAGGKFPKKTARRTRCHRRRDVIRFRLRNRRRPLLMRWKHYSAILHSKRHRLRLPPSFYPRPKRKGKRREIKTRIYARDRRDTLKLQTQHKQSVIDHGKLRLMQICVCCKLFES